MKYFNACKTVDVACTVVVYLFVVVLLSSVVMLIHNALNREKNKIDLYEKWNFIKNKPRKQTEILISVSVYMYLGIITSSHNDAVIC